MSYDEPTVVAVFGDHQPNLSFKRELRDEYSLFGKDGKYLVPFMIWANYDIEEKYIDITSPAYLSGEIKDVRGIAKNSWDIFRDEMYRSYPVLTLKSIYDKDKNKIDMDSMNSDILKNYGVLQYGILFDGIDP